MYLYEKADIVVFRKRLKNVMFVLRVEDEIMGCDEPIFQVDEKF